MNLMSNRVVMTLQDRREIPVDHLGQDADSLMCPFHNMWHRQDVKITQSSRYATKIFAESMPSLFSSCTAQYRLVKSVFIANKSRE